MPDIQVLILAEDPLARLGLASILDDQDGLRLLGQASPYVPLETLPESADALLLDVGWSPDWRSLRRLTGLGLPILALLSDVEQAAPAQALLAGLPTYGLLLRQSQAPRLIAALRALQGGLLTLDPALGNALFAAPNPLEDAPAEDLTSREREVLHLLAQGMTNKAIAQALHISDNTVKFHVNAIMGKLGAQSRTDAVIRATRAGLVVL